MTPALDLDGPWKEALETYLEEALALLFPPAHAAIDWGSEYQWLDVTVQVSASLDEALKFAIRKGERRFVR